MMMLRIVNVVYVSEIITFAKFSYDFRSRKYNVPNARIKSERSIFRFDFNGLKQERTKRKRIEHRMSCDVATGICDGRILEKYPDISDTLKRVTMNSKKTE